MLNNWTSFDIILHLVNMKNELSIAAMTVFNSQKIQKEKIHPKTIHWLIYKNNIKGKLNYYIVNKSLQAN